MISIVAAFWLAFGGEGSSGPTPILTAEVMEERLPPLPGEEGGARIAHQDQTVFEIVGPGRDSRRKSAMAPGAEAPVMAPGDGLNLRTNEKIGGPVQLLPPNPSPERIDPPRMTVGLTPQTGALPETPPIAPRVGDAVNHGAPAQLIIQTDQEATASLTDLSPQAVFPPRRLPELSGNFAVAAAEPAAPMPIANQPVLPAKRLEPTVAPAPDEQLASLPPESTFLVQVGAVRDKATAQREWRRIRTRNSDILGSLQLFIQEVNITGKGVFHRIQAGPLPDEVLANLACGQLRGRGLGCFVVAK
jgi:hypothetical protein